MKLNITIAFDFDIITDPDFKKILDRSDFLVLPEMFYGGYEVFKENKQFFIPENHNVILKLKELSKDNLSIIAGSMPIGKTWKDRKNTSLVFDKGRVIYKYEKIHLFKPLREDNFFKPGAEIKNFTITKKGKQFRCSTIICYDLRFPELSRLKALKGLDILFVPAWWPVERNEIWVTLLRARAIENQIFVIGANSGDDRCGFSYVFSPNGRLVFSTENEIQKPYFTFSIDTQEISKIKSFLDCLKDAKVLTKNFIK
jgi:omega-amidase